MQWFNFWAGLLICGALLVTLNDVVYGSVDWKDFSVKFLNLRNTRKLELELKIVPSHKCSIPYLHYQI